MKNEEVIFENMNLKNEGMVEFLNKTLDFNKKYLEFLNKKVLELKQQKEELVDKHG